MELLDFTIVENKRKRLHEIPSDYLEKIEALAKESDYYPKYHLAPKCGLMNDPNGLVHVDGWYHIFYQWFPLGPVHGLKHWYHVKTKDFVEYIDMGVGIYPDTALDQEGCYSGMMTSDKTVYYTGVDENLVQNVVKAEFVDEKIVNKEMCIIHDDARTTRNFRDPFVFLKDGTQFMFVGAEDVNNVGRLDLFENVNGRFVGRGFTDMGATELGFMLECPNLVNYEEQDILIFSPQGITSPDKYTYRNVFSVCYAIGKLNTKSNKFDTEEYMELDKGFDFYAPQIFTDEQGRHIMLAWFGNSKCEYPSDFEQWTHLMTLPRELKIIDETLVQIPIEELEGLRQGEIVLQKETILNTKCFELEIDAETGFSIKIENEKGENITFEGTEDEYILSRGEMTHVYNEEYGTKRYAKRNVNAEKIRIFVDRSAIEIFADSNKVVFTSRFYIDNFNKLSIKNCSGILYKLKQIDM